LKSVCRKFEILEIMIADADVLVDYLRGGGEGGAD
jgi:hypothetical protein